MLCDTLTSIAELSLDNLYKIKENLDGIQKLNYYTLLSVTENMTILFYIESFLIFMASLENTVN